MKLAETFRRFSCYPFHHGHPRTGDHHMTVGVSGPCKRRSVRKRLISTRNQAALTSNGLPLGNVGKDQAGMVFQAVPASEKARDQSDKKRYHLYSINRVRARVNRRHK